MFDVLPMPCHVAKYSQMLAGSLLAFLHLVVSYIFYARGRLSPLLNMIVSGPVLLVYTIGFALLVWNMYGTLSHSCSKTNWANDDGMFVCRVYKAFFSFVVIGWLCQIALIIVDVRAKRVQSTLGRYNKMDETSSKDVKLESLDHSRNTSTQDIPYGIDDYRDQSNSTNSVNAQHQRYSSPYDAERSQLHRVDDFYYETPPQHTTYQPQQSYPNTNHYQPTYDGMRLR